MRDEVQYDCAQALTRTMQETAFDAGGRELKRLTQASAWSAVQLDTIGYESMRFACRARLAADRPAPEAAPADLPTTKTPERRPVPPAPASPPPASRSAWVQVVAGPTQAAARSVLATLARADPEAARLTAHVQAASVHGRTVYRGVLTGFPSPRAAAAFCRRISRAGQGCLVKTGPAPFP